MRWSKTVKKYIHIHAYAYACTHTHTYAHAVGNIHDCTGTCIHALICYT